MARKNITASRKNKKHSVLTKVVSQSGYDTATLIQDIQKSASVFYGNKPIYIHNNGRNFATAATIANTKLGTELIKLRKIWESEARELIQLCEQNENIFFSRVQSATNKKFDRQSFKSYIAQVLEDVTSTINLAWQQTEALPKGKKTKEQLQSIAEIYKNLQVKLNSYTNKVSLVNTNFIKMLQEREKGINAVASHLSKVTKKDFKNLGASVRSLVVYVLPKAFEELLLYQFAEIFGDDNVKSVAEDTKLGTSGDMEVFGANFSVKSGDKHIKQEKSRILKTFFNYNKELNTTDGNNIIGSVDSLLKDRKVDNIIKYILMNYAAIREFNDKSIIENAIKIIVLTSLNEKMFGYNKKYQTTSLTQLIPQFPIAVINKSGEIVYMSDIMQQVIDSVKQDYNNINKLATFSFYSNPFSQQKVLRQKKKEALSSLPANKINYKNLKSLIIGTLTDVNNELLSSILLNVQYHINIHSAISSIE